MKMTLLEIVQAILTSMDGDQVNSISDTTESDSVARIVKECWQHIVSNADLPEHFDLFELEASGDVSKPTLMTLPETVDRTTWIKYNCQEATDPYPVFKEMKFMPLWDFLHHMYNLPAATDTTIGTFTQTVGTSNIAFYYRNDKAPEFYTSFDDYNLVFDSYDSAVDDTLQKSKSLCYGKIIPTFTFSDLFVPDLDANMFQVLLQEAKAQCFNELRQMDNPRADRRVRQGWIKSQRDKMNIGKYTYQTRPDLPNYGRR
jgi:hypothetical protein